MMCENKIFSFLIISLIGWSSAFAQRPATVHELSNWWTFALPKKAQATLQVLRPAGEFAAKSAEEGFTLRFEVDLQKFEGYQPLVDIPSILSVSLRRADPNDRDRQNYPTYRMADGSLPTLEAGLWLYRPDKDPQLQKMTIGFPLAMIQNSYGKHEVVLNFTGAHFVMYVDNERVDSDFPIGYPQWKAKTAWTLNPAFVSQAELFMPAIQPTRGNSTKPTVHSQVQYWTPPGHNSWVGDIAALYHNGRYHIFYLYDRRHHASKFGCGGHYFEHISTTDFKNWTEHEAATPIDEQWETFGTGTPFVIDDKLCVSYGLHTSRLYPEDQTMLPALKEYFDKHGKSGFFNNNSFPTIPSGATYSISQDGISNFKKNSNIFHFCENPTIYTDAEGKLTMLANFRSKGMWQSESIDGDWYPALADFPPGGDCTFYFRWGKFDYIIGGFVDLWSKPASAPNTAYESVKATGEDFYNGFSVPTISEISNGRFLMAGWLPVRGWGGPLLIHELIQYPDGRIGTKWMEELAPMSGTPQSIANLSDGLSFYDTDHQSFLLSFDVTPKGKDSRFAVSFLPAEGADKGCEFQVNASNQTAQYAPANFKRFADPEKSLRNGGNPQSARNYALEKLIGIDKPYSVRIAVTYTDKLGGVLIDSEIAGQRTMITYRPDLLVQKLMFRLEQADMKNIRIAPM
ncbi:MAG: hypothetical protein LBU37_14045 [Tannerellaceae bacterium]|jgi:hypothetical protein|nr:hypothetical protein [Tannerellaceae bacterium]